MVYCPHENISTEDELNEAKSRWSEDSWQISAMRLINSEKVQKLMICLLLMDVIILFAELGESHLYRALQAVYIWTTNLFSQLHSSNVFLTAIDAWYPYCSFVVRDAISCCPAEGATDGDRAEHDGHRFLGGGGWRRPR